MNTKTSWIVGRDENCDLVVAESAVSSRHCRLTLHDRGYTVEDLDSTNGTFVNGVRLTPGDPVWVQHGAHVTLGSRVEMPWPPEPSPAQPNAAEPFPAQPADPGAASATGPQRVPTAVGGPAHPIGSRPITIGRDPKSVVQIDLPNISWNHATITVENGQYILEDNSSRNGISIGELGNRIQRAVLDPADDVYLGSYKISAALLLSHEKKVEIGEGGAGHIVKFAGKSMVIGRDPECEVPLSFPMVSWRHARLTRAPEGILVEDLDSRNGTFVDGIRVTGKVLAKPGQEIGLGSFRFQLLEGGELAQREYYGNVTIEANNIVVLAPNGKRLLDPISLTVFPSELVALMGPAGAGKTTLLKALNGYTRPVEGSVLFNGNSLYDFYDRFRQQMGYVPQDDIVHPQLTVRQALYFSARLRTDLTDREIDARTEKVLADLGIPDKIDTVIGSPERKTLSGGQRKRVNIALELITDTPLLFLDEPTSGLSSYDAESVVDMLKALSRTGKTIITTIHQPSLKVYKQFDDLLMVSRDKGDSPGALVFFGPAFPDSIQFFNPPPPAPPDATLPMPPPPQDLNPEMLFSGMNTVPESARTQAWRKRFQNSKYYKEFVADRSGKQPASSGKSGEDKPRRVFGLKQWFALVKRNVIVKLQDRAQTTILLLQAIIFAGLVALVNYPVTPDHFDDLARKLPIIHFLMVVAAIWFGCNNAARDIVGEWTIYKRERMVTLKLIPYVFSKLAVLLALCIFQCGAMLGIVYYTCNLRSNFLNDFYALLLSSMIGAGLGLVISAISKTNESAIALLPLVLLPMIALGGGMAPIYQLPKAGQIITMAIPSRWSFEANLLGEAGKWKSNLMPDPREGCSAILPKAPAIAMPKPGKPPTPPPQPTQECKGNDPSVLCGDAAEGSFPKSLITFNDEKGNEQTCRSADNQGYPLTNPTVHAVSNRHDYQYSMSVLGGMMVLLLVSVIAILRKRDGDLQ